MGKIHHIGYTGTQVGCTRAQRLRRKELFESLKQQGFTTLHHGSCIGSDREAHLRARQVGLAIELHPPLNTSRMAVCEMLPGEIVHPAKEYIARNHDIVDETCVLVATPKEEEGEELRSGTWATVRYARKLGRHIYIIRPSGLLETERLCA